MLFLSSFWSSFVFHDAGWIVLFMIEAVSFSFVFYRQKALYLAALMFRWLWHATCFVLWEGSFHLGAFFPWVHTPIYFCWFLYAALFLYLYTHASTLMKQRFIYGVRFTRMSRFICADIWTAGISSVGIIFRCLCLRRTALPI